MELPRAEVRSAPALDRPQAPSLPRPEKRDRERLVLVAIPDADLAKETASALEERGLDTSIVHDGVEAMLEIQRQLPRVVVLSASLPKMYGFQICEVMKRNESLRSIPVVLAGSIYHTDRYRREPNQLYGADAYLEDPDLPDGLLPILEKLGVAMAPDPAPTSAPPSPVPASGSSPEAAPQRAPAPLAPTRGVAPARTAPAATREGDGLAEQRAKAERLARIIVSDIVLYNEDRFAEAIRRGSVLEMLSSELEEGRDLFRSRIDARVRGERDHLADELLRVARLRAEA
jgi:CheY-like chemotaxis protein